MSGKKNKKEGGARVIAWTSKKRQKTGRKEHQLGGAGGRELRAYA